MQESPMLRAFVNAFIILHLCIIVVWGLPRSQFRSLIMQPLKGYVGWSGLWHSWAMFSPNPLSVNFNVVAEVTFEDESTAVWEFPRMEKLGLWERFRKERYRKWRERVRLDSYREIWEDTSRYVARLHDNPTNRPTIVTLKREWLNIPAPVKGDYQPIPKTYHLTNSYTFSYYQVQKGDL